MISWSQKPFSAWEVLIPFAKGKCAWWPSESSQSVPAYLTFGYMTAEAWHWHFLSVISSGDRACPFTGWERTHDQAEPKLLKAESRRNLALLLTVYKIKIEKVCVITQNRAPFCFSCWDWLSLYRALWTHFSTEAIFKLSRMNNTFKGPNKSFHRQAENFQNSHGHTVLLEGSLTIHIQYLKHIYVLLINNSTSGNLA